MIWMQISALIHWVRNRFERNLQFRSFRKNRLHSMNPLIEWLRSIPEERDLNEIIRPPHGCRVNQIPPEYSRPTETQNLSLVKIRKSYLRIFSSKSYISNVIIELLIIMRKMEQAPEWWGRRAETQKKKSSADKRPELPSRYGSHRRFQPQRWRKS